MESGLHAADNDCVRQCRILCLLLAVIPAVPSDAWRILYAEQYYELYHRHFYQYPEDSLENIFYLEQALKSDFCNPLYALARIETRVEAERYRDLFRMHVHLKLTELYLLLGSKYDKMKAYYYNAPWRKANLDSLDTAVTSYRIALLYWDDAKQWSGKAWENRSIHLEEIQYWEDESFRIETGELDYSDIIGSHLQRLQEVREEFEGMDDSTF